MLTRLIEKIRIEEAIAPPPFLSGKNSNGLKIVALKSDCFFANSAVLKVSAGATTAPYLPGAAHLLEHLLFKRGALHNSDPLAELGIDANAYTDYEKSAFHFAVSKRSGDFPFGIRELLKMVYSPDFSDEQFRNEVEIVASEIRDELSDPDEFAEARFRAELFGNSAYGSEILGAESLLRRYARRDVLGFHSVNYLPRRSVLALCGNLGAGSAAEIAGSALAAANKRGAGKFIRSDMKPVETELPKPPPGTGKVYIAGFGRIKKLNADEVVRLRALQLVLLQLAFRVSSRLFAGSLSDGIFNSSFAAVREFEPSYQLLAFKQTGSRGRAFADTIRRIVTGISQGEYSDSELYDAVKSSAGIIVLQFRDPQSAAELISDIYLLGEDMESLNRCLRSVRQSDLAEFCKTLIKEFKFHFVP